MPSVQSNLQTFRGNLGFWMLRSPQTEGEYTVQVHSKMFCHNNVNLIFRKDNSPKLSKVVSNKPRMELQCHRMKPWGKEMALYVRVIWTRFTLQTSRILFLDISKRLHNFSLGKKGRGKCLGFFFFFLIENGKLTFPQFWTQIPPRMMFYYGHNHSYSVATATVLTCFLPATKRGIMMATRWGVSRHKVPKQRGFWESFFFNLCVVPRDHWRVTLKWIKHWYLSKTGAAYPHRDDRRFIH